MNIENKPIESLSEEIAPSGDYDPLHELASYKYPNIELLKNYEDINIIDAEILEINKNKIVETFNYSHIEINEISAIVGPSITLYEFIPAPGIRVSKIKSLKDDLALSLASEINILGPIPGKGTMGIEVPHKNPSIVSIRSVLATEKFHMCDFDLPIAFGKTMTNEVFLADLTKFSHLLISGATGQGKSVCLNAILFSLLYKKHPSQLKFVLIDTRNIELGMFHKIEHHFLAKLPEETEAIVTDKLKASKTLNGLNIELDERYNLMKYAAVRQIKDYNQKFIARKLNPGDGHRYLPFIVVVIDEFAELLTDNKEIELVISRLAQLGRAVGIHLIISTQRASVKTITGIIKANFTARLAFRVASAIDSRTILDSSGAELLNGHGDMLLSTGTEIIHLQGAYVDTMEVEKLSEFIGNQRGYPNAYMLPQYGMVSMPTLDFDLDNRDSMFEDAARLIVMHQQGSTSLIQRKLKLGYNRAGRIIDQLEAAGIIGPFDGGRAREVKLLNDHALEVFLDSMKSDNSSHTIPKPLKVQPIPSHMIKKEHTQTKIETNIAKAAVLAKSSIELGTKSTKQSFWKWLFG